MKIAIEGMDGVGKTTIAKTIAEKNGFMYIDKPLHYFFKDNAENGYQDLMEMANKLYDVEDPVIRAWFFGLGNLFCFRNFENQDFIVDRHFVSNYFWNGEEDSEKVFHSMIDIVGKPDLTVLLYASPETRLQRLQQRDPDDKDLFDSEKQVDGYDKMINFVNKFDLNYILINTENRTVESICDELNKTVVDMKNVNEVYPKKLIKA